MKNTIKYMCMIALMALAFTSCKKTETEEKEHHSTFKATIEDFEYEDADGEKAYIGQNLRVYFEDDDVCMAFNMSEDDPLSSHCATYEVVNNDNGTATFQNCDLGEVAEDMLDAYYAFYPGNIVTNDGIEHHVITELSEGENKMKFYVSPSQTYREDMVSRNALIMAAMVDDVDHLSEAHFSFRNLFGVLRLQPYEAAQRSVTSIEIVDNTFTLTGWVELIIPEIGVSKGDGFNFIDFDKGGNTVTLNCEVPVQLGVSKPTTPAFNIVLRPLALSQGFHIIFSFDDGSVKDVDLSSYNSLMIRPNVVWNQGLNLDNY